MPILLERQDQITGSRSKYRKFFLMADSNDQLYLWLANPKRKETTHTLMLRALPPERSLDRFLCGGSICRDKDWPETVRVTDFVTFAPVNGNKTALERALITVGLKIEK